MKKLLLGLELLQEGEEAEVVAATGDEVVVPAAGGEVVTEAEDEVDGEGNEEVVPEVDGDGNGTE